LKKLFENTYVKCFVCGTLLNGKVKQLGNKYYCEEHYEKELEKPDNQMKKKEMNWFTKHFDISR
jgi:hypothetical protein